uniref:DUF3305 domain-containing protein n=1 Tax=Chelativorans sp. YIM 93263 TaxID=2906648 RepID=UPI0023797100|nr:DUF3305 domain-containing protein [Chelativorans sp. YIM 93263]
MITDVTEVGVIVERRVLKNPWADHAWVPVAVLAGAPVAAPWTVLSETPEATRYFAGAFQLQLFASETGMYRDNLHSRQPSLWISLRPSRTPPGVALHLVTADPSEAEARTEPGTDIVEAVPMPPEIEKRLAAFVAAHHVERPFVKRKRDRPDIEAMARKIPGK